MDKRKLGSNQNRNFKRNNNNKPTTVVPGKKRKIDDYEEAPPKKLKIEQRNDVSYTSRDNYSSTSRDNYSSTSRNNYSSGSKFSVNDRLKKLRSVLSTKKGAICKVHTAFKHVTNGSKNNNTQPGPSTDQGVFVFGKNSTRDTAVMPNYDEDVDMEWSPINDEKVVADINKVRNSISKQQQQASNLSLATTFNNNNSSVPCKSSLVYIVIDTNIFISDLGLIKRIINIQNKDAESIAIYIPWMVMQELDHFKDGRGGSNNMQKIARAAVAFLNKMLTSENKLIKVQTVHEALDQTFSTVNADDCILFTCIKLKENNQQIILLSNDVNLRNKALAHQIETYGSKNIIEKVTKRITGVTMSDEKIKTVISMLTNTCAGILTLELEKAYGSKALQAMVEKPPWDLNRCLEYFNRFWMPVFSYVTHKQCVKALEELTEFTKCQSNLQDTNLKRFIELSLNFCIYFNGHASEHSKLIRAFIQKVQEL